MDSHAKKNPDKSALPVDSVTTTAEKEPKVIGIGGIFFYADSLAATQEWYRKNLGIELNDWGSASFDSRKIDDPEEEQSLQWKPFAKGDAYFAPSQKDFMINYQVQNLEGLLERLRKMECGSWIAWKPTITENLCTFWMRKAIKSNSGSLQKNRNKTKKAPLYINRAFNFVGVAG